MTRALSTMPVRLIIFDADDTLRRTTIPGQPCPHAPGEWKLLPGVTERLRALYAGNDGLALGVASNQDHVGYGIISGQAACDLLRAMVDAALGSVSPPTAVTFCPHPVEARCNCRKPGPGMLLRLMEHFGTEPHRTLMVGNGRDDQKAAARAGVRFMWANTFFA